MHRRLAPFLIATLLALTPFQAWADDPGREHVVRAGDTLIGIAGAYGVSLSSLMEANGLPNADLIWAGQVLRIPSSLSGGTQTAAPSPQTADLADPATLEHPAQRFPHAYAHERAGEPTIAALDYRSQADAATSAGREALLGLARSLLRSGDAAGAASSARALLAAAPGEPRAWVVLGRALERAGDLSGSAQAFRHALAAGAQPAAYLRLRLARVTGSVEDYRAVLADAEALGRWKAEAARALGDPNAYAYAAPRQQAEVLRDSAQWAELARRHPCHADAARGMGAAGLLHQATTLYCRGAVGEAEALLSQRASETPARIYLAKMRANLDDFAGALAAVEPLLYGYQGAWTAEVWLEAARAYAGLGRWDEAAGAFARFSLAYPVSMGWEDMLAVFGGWHPVRDPGLPQHPLGDRIANVRRLVEDMAFRAGLERYRAGDRAGAAAHWRHWAAAGVSPSGLARLLLWQGKADPSRATELWRRAAEADPEGYYGLRARALLEGATPGGGMDGPARAAWPRLPEAWLATFAPPRASTLSETVLLAFDHLEAHGLWEEADEIARDAISGQVGDPRSLTVLALGLYERDAYRLASAAMGHVLAHAPPTPLAELPGGVQTVLFPPAFADEIWRWAGAHGLDPALLAGLVKIESLFDPYAVSSARAMGLTQFIPSTARAVAAEVGEADFSLGELFRPEVALKMGAYYLQLQLGRFGWWGQAAAAYNGGSGNAYRWGVQAGGDRDLFVELISFAETSAYVRRLEQARHHFARLY